VQVGFQGEDPSTDFRGTGRLGYDNLLYFVNTYPNKAKKLLAIAHDKKTEYFFACASINVTFFLKKMLPTENDLCVFLGGARTVQGICFRFNEFFCRVFEEFIEYWRTSPKNTTFMNFNIVLVT
jgi:hypothetical protein